jgi:hypothetical protein
MVLRNFRARFWGFELLMVSAKLRCGMPLNPAFSRDGAQSVRLEIWTPLRKMD